MKPGAVISDKTNALPVNALAFTLRSSSLHSTTPSPPPQEPTATTTESGFSRSNLFTRPHALPAKPTVGSFSPPGKRIASSSLPAEQANKRVAGVHDAKMILGATKENGAPPAKLDAYALKRQEDERRIAAIELEQERKREEAQKAKQQEIEAQEEREAELRKRELARVQEAGRRREEEEREAKEQVARKAEEERLAKEQAAQKAEEEREAQRKESERKKAEEEAAASKAAEEKGKAETEERAMLLADPSKLVAKLGSQVSTQAKLQTTIKDVTELELTLENAEKSFEEAREKVAGAEVELEKAQMAVEEAKEDFETHRQQVIDTENKLKELKDALHGLAIAAVDELEAAEAAATAKAEALKKQQASTSSPMARFNPNRYKSNGMSKTPTKAPPLPYGDPLASAHKAMSEIERQHEKVETEDQLIFKAWPKQAEREYRMFIAHTCPIWPCS